jgi:hypothetical protein
VLPWGETLAKLPRSPPPPPLGLEKPPEEEGGLENLPELEKPPELKLGRPLEMAGPAGPRPAWVSLCSRQEHNQTRILIIK